MYNITINEFMFYGLVVFSIVILFTIVLVFIAHIYHIKRMYDFFDKINEQTLDKTITYSNQFYKFNKNIKKCGIKKCNFCVSMTKKLINKYRDFCK